MEVFSGDLPKITGYLQAVCPQLLDFDTVVLLGCRIADCEQPVINDRYALAEVNAGHKRLVRDSEAEFPDPYRFCSSHCVIAFNRSSKTMPFDRFSTYLNNLCNRGDPNAPGIDLCRIDLKTAQCELRRKNSGWFECPADVFDRLFALDNPNNPSLDDFDIRLILDLIGEKDDGNHLFKGIGDCREERGAITTPNYRNNACFDKDQLQQRERELTDRMLNHRNYAGTRADAIIDLALDGRDANLAVLTENPLVAMYVACASWNSVECPAGIAVLPKAELPVRREVAYPVKENFMLHPESAGPGSALLKAQSGVFVYCREGHISGDDGGALESIWIPNRAVPLMLRHTGLAEHDVYPDVRSLLMEPWNLESFSDSG